MCTLFDVIQLLGFVVGALAGGLFGWQWMGVVGLVVGGGVERPKRRRVDAFDLRGGVLSDWSLHRGV